MDDPKRVAIDPSSIDAVLFDLDGTLMDTDDQVVEKLANRLGRIPWLGLHHRARGLVMAMETPANFLMTALDTVGLDGPLLGVRKRLQNLRGGARKPTYRLMADTKATLADLGQRYRLAVVTTRGRSDAGAFLEQHGLQDAFDVIVTREDTWRLKPHPAPIERAAKLLGIPVERCVMVGDTTVDMRSASRAGARAVAVTCGFGERRELKRAGADVVLKDIASLSSVL